MTMRRKSGRRRGRPRQKHAKRRCTTTVGRRTGRDPVDAGSPQLRARKRSATTREDALAFVTSLLRQVHRAMGGNLSVAGLWTAIIGALV